MDTWPTILTVCLPTYNGEKVESKILIPTERHGRSQKFCSKWLPWRPENTVLPRVLVLQNFTDDPYYPKDAQQDPLFAEAFQP